MKLISTRIGLLLAAATAALALAAPSAQAAGEAHPFLASFTGPFAEPNGIAIDESSGDVYVADLATASVYKFTEGGAPIAGFGDTAPSHDGKLAGIETPAGSFSFPTEGYGTPAALAVDNSSDPSDPSRGDLYVMDAGHGVIDKFDPQGVYLGQIAAFEPAGSREGALRGLAVGADGVVRAELSPEFGKGNQFVVHEFDDSSANRLLAEQVNERLGGNNAGMPVQSSAAYGFAVGPTGDDYRLYDSPCACTVKLGQQLAALGQLDRARSGDLALAVDPSGGHVYTDAGASISEWDTGAMNGGREVSNLTHEKEPAGTLVTSFGAGQLTASGRQGGIAVDGATGRIYVSDPADDKVYVFATDTPAPTTDPATGITKETATLNGAVNPRGAGITACEFEYGVADEYGRATYEHVVGCDPGPVAIGEGRGPVPVSAHVAGLKAGELYRFRLKVAAVAGSNQSAGLFATPGVGFGVKKFEMSFLNEDGTPDTQAGSHPDELVNELEFNSHYVRAESNADSLFMRVPDGTLRDVRVDLPPGLVGDPNATKKKCTLENLDELQSGAAHVVGCSPESLLGVFSINTSVHAAAQSYIESFHEPVFNMVPPHGVAAQFGIEFLNPDLFINSGLLAGGDYPIETTLSDIPPAAPVLSSRLTIYGVVPNCVHVGAGQGRYLDAFCRARGLEPGGTGQWEREEGGRPFLTLPTACNGALRSTISVDSWQETGHWTEPVEAVSHNAAGGPVSVTGCSKLLFPPTLSQASPDISAASSPTGFTTDVHISQAAAKNPDGLAESNMREAVVTLPEGMTLDPSGADGLEGCTEQQAGFTGMKELNPSYEPGVETPTFTPTMPEPLQPGQNFCPNGSKVATATIHSPLLEEPVEGSIYLATPDQNPFGSLVAMYLIAEDPISGTIVKQAGEVSLDPQSGRLVTTFRQTPDVPFEDLTLHFFGGNRAPLVTPAACGTYTTKAVFTPWDGNGPVTSESSFKVDSGQNGSACPSGGVPPFHPQLNAGTTNNRAGSYSPLDIELSRGDSEQEFTHFSLKLPPGLSGKLAGVAKCSDAAIAAAKTREREGGGGEEEQSPSCPANSQIGHTLVGAGVGSVLVWVPGKVYLAGPYHGAPISVVAITDAKAGPFDLGTVVVREALRVNPETAEVFVDATGSDPLPHIVDGIPTHLRKVLVFLDRPEFTINPTSCERTSIASTVLGSGADFTSEADDQPVTVATPFQAADCAALGFKPKLALQVKGPTHRGGVPAFKATLTYPKGGPFANVAKSVLTLPFSEILEQGHIGTSCTRVQFSEGGGNGEHCPAASVYGRARAVTPLLSEPLEGPVYLRSNGGERNLPDLVAALHGQEINVDLVGFIDAVQKKGAERSRLRTTFAAVPDAPVSKFTLEMNGGSKGLLVNTTDICQGAHRAVSVFTGQNGKRYETKPKVVAKGCGKHPKRAKKKHGKHRRARR